MDTRRRTGTALAAVAGALAALLLGMALVGRPTGTGPPARPATGPAAPLARAAPGPDGTRPTEDPPSTTTAPAATEALSSTDFPALRARAPGAAPPGPAGPRAAPPHPPAAPPAGNLASRLRTLPAGTGQVVIVHTAGYGRSTGTLEAFSRTGGTWRPAFAPMAARIGARGFADRKVEGDLTTPTGVYGLGPTVYGLAPAPGLRYPYHRLVPGDYWDENPASPGYNSFTHGTDPDGASEALWQVDPQYRYFAVIDYNVPVRPAIPARGSGIFLHVRHPGHATAGCVALAEPDLLAVLRWLDPAAAPRVVLAPTGNLPRY